MSRPVCLCVRVCVCVFARAHAHMRAYSMCETDKQIDRSKRERERERDASTSQAIRRLAALTGAAPGPAAPRHSPPLPPAGARGPTPAAAAADSFNSVRFALEHSAGLRAGSAGRSTERSPAHPPAGTPARSPRNPGPLSPRSPRSQAVPSPRAAPPTSRPSPALASRSPALASRSPAVASRPPALASRSPSVGSAAATSADYPPRVSPLFRPADPAGGVGRGGGAVPAMGRGAAGGPGPREPTPRLGPAMKAIRAFSISRSPEADAGGGGGGVGGGGGGVVAARRARPGSQRFRGGGGGGGGDAAAQHKGPLAFSRAPAVRGHGGDSDDGPTSPPLTARRGASEGPRAGSEASPASMRPMPDSGPGSRAYQLSSALTFSSGPGRSPQLPPAGFGRQEAARRSP
jgi:hypothetical protein